MPNKDMFPEDLQKEQNTRIGELEYDLKNAIEQSRELLEVYYQLQLMLGDVAGEGEIPMHTESKWFTKLWELTDEFDPEMNIFKDLERLKGHVQEVVSEKYKVQ